MTVIELFLKSIWDVYKIRKARGLITNPWPEIKAKVVEDIIYGVSPLGNEDLFEDKLEVKEKHDCCHVNKKLEAEKEGKKDNFDVKNRVEPVDNY